MHKGKIRTRRGATLIELIVAVAIVMILAAVAIPVVSSYARDSRISEGMGNVQGILEAEEAFFVRFQRYTLNLGWCPLGMPAAGLTQAWPTPDANNLMPCGGNNDQRREWALLGWKPNGATYFHYRVFTAYGPDPNDATRIIPRYHPTIADANISIAPGMAAADDYVANRALTFGIEWNTEVNPDPDGNGIRDANDMPPWCAVEAEADTDADGKEVYIRVNSLNHKYNKIPNPRDHNTRAW